MKYIKLFILGLLVYSCDNISDVLEQSDDINVILLETTSLPIGNPGDTISFKVLATTNDIIKRVELTENCQGFERWGGAIRYESVDTIGVAENG